MSQRAVSAQPRFRTTNFSRDRGSALISVMLAAAIGTTVSLGIAGIMSNMQLDQNNLKFRGDGDVFNEEIRSLLSSPKACLNTFGGMLATQVASNNVTQLRDETVSPGAVKYALGQTYGDRSLVIKTMSLLDYAGQPASTKAEMTLLSVFGSVKESKGAQTIPRKVRISLEKDASNRIISCIALAKMSDGIWQRTTTNIDNIFFAASSTGGNVGINAADPQWALQINADSATQDGSVVINQASSARSPSLKMFRTNGTFAAPSFVTNGQAIGNLAFSGFWQGKNSSQFVQNDGRAQIQISATQDWSSTTKNGTAIAFLTTPNDTSANFERLRIDHSGNVGIGWATAAPYWPLTLKTTSNTTDGAITINHTSSLRAPSLKMFLANGGPGAETYVTQNQTIGNLGFSGYWQGKAAPEFKQGEGRAAISVISTENWTSASNTGTAIYFATTPNGTGSNFERLRIDQSGNIGIGFKTSDPYWPVTVNSTSNTVDGAFSINQIGSRPAGLKLFSAQGTPASPSPVTNGATLGDVGFSGFWGGKSVPEFRMGEARAYIRGIATEYWSDSTHNGAKLVFGTTPNGYQYNFPRMVIDESGFVGINNSSPSYNLDVGGIIRSSNVTNTSDARLKHDVAPLTDALDKITRIDGVTFRWNDPGKSQDRQIGVIAQNVERVFPELVSADRDGVKSVDYAHLVAPLIEAIKTLSARAAGDANVIRDLEARANVHDRDFASLRTENERLRRRLEASERDLARQAQRVDEIRAIICATTPSAKFCVSR